jgi:hypothetical protein
MFSTYDNYLLLMKKVFLKLMQITEIMSMYYMEVKVDRFKIVEMSQHYGLFFPLNQGSIKMQGMIEYYFNYKAKLF